jgi:RNA polymerase sigma-70 factor (ECF subfamily)
MAAEAWPEGSADPITRRILEGEYRDAIAMCAREHAPAIGRLCMSMLGSQAEAEETVQETLITAHGAMASYRGEGSVRAWLFGIARRLCARRIETRVRRDRKLKLVHDADSEAGLPDAVVERRRRAQLVRAALEELKPSERDVVVLRYDSGLSYREIAEAIGIDEAAARKRTSRALARLRTILQKEVQ